MGPEHASGPGPNQASILILAEQHDEWAEMRRYLSLEALAKARLSIIDGDADNPANQVPTALEALTA